MNTRGRRSRCTVMAAGIGGLLAIGMAGACSGSVRGSGPAQPRPDGRANASFITADDIRQYPSFVSVEEILAAHAPGLWLTRRHEPGGAMTLQVLGMGAPLYVIDGVPHQSSAGTLGLNPHDIESMEILKFGSAGSLYGLRGANGVVLITTKHTQ